MDLSTLTRVEGPNLVLRLIRPDDAEYVHKLRMDPAYNTHLSKVQGSVEDQRRWIVGYKAREAVGQEFYYVIERKDSQRCGLVRLYDFTSGSFTWGSWILDENKPRMAALESAVLSFGLGFENLGLARALVDVRIGNTHATAFYRRLGMTEISRTDQDAFFVYPRERYKADCADHMKVLEESETKL